MPKSIKRIRVYGQPKAQIDPDLLVQVLILLGRELHAKHFAEASASPPASGKPESDPETGT